MAKAECCESSIAEKGMLCNVAERECCEIRNDIVLGKGSYECSVARGR